MSTTELGKQDSTKKAHPMVRLFRYEPQLKPIAIRGVVLSTLNKFFDIAPELLLGIAIDVVVRSQDSFVASQFGIADRKQQLIFLAVVTAIVWALESITQYLAELNWRGLAQRVQHELRLQAVGRVQNLDMRWFEDSSTGSVQTVLSEDVNQLERFLDVGANKIVLTITNVIFVGAVFLAISPTLAAYSFLPIPIIVGGSLIFQKRLQPLYMQVREKAGEVGALIAANLGGIATIKAFQAEKQQLEQIDTASRAYRSANLKAIRFSSAFVPLIRMAILCGFVVTMIVGGNAAIDGTLEVGFYSVLIFMTQRLLWPLTDLGETLDLYQRGMASATRIVDLIDTPSSIHQGNKTLPATATGEIELDNVSFGYDPQRPILKNISLKVPGKQTHALVGPTGSGKSTLLKLLLRFYDQTQGTIKIDGVQSQKLTFASLRGASGYVGQDTFLFEGTIRENLLYANPQANETELQQALTLSESSEFVTDLPDGIDSVVGERGIKLSGGQRQRLSIARAILKNPLILLLDEATSAVDNETEAAIQRSLAKVAHERTMLVVAHRLSTIRNADMIHFLHDGQIVESGNHNQLLAQKGRYAAMWAVQTGEA